MPLSSSSSRTAATPSAPSPAEGQERTAEAANQAALLATTGLEVLPQESVERLPALLEAMVTIGTGPEIHSTLDRIVETAARVADCRYAALGVLAEGRTGLRDFVTCGMSDEVIARIDHLPDGKHGLLAVVLEQDEPLRLRDLADDPRSCGFPPHHPPMHSFLGLPIKVGDEVFGNLYLTEKRGGGDFTDNDVLLIKILATQAGIAIGNARQHEAARQHARWIDGSAAVTTSLLAGDVDNALAVVAEEARRLADAAAAMVLMPREEGGLVVVAVSAEDARGFIGTVVPPDSPLLPPLLAGEPVYVDDAATDPRTSTGLARLFGPSMMLPMESDGRVVGTLAIPRAPGAEAFTEAEKSLAARFAAQAALALVLAEAQRDREQLAVYEDRDRIARDLHDLVIQRLFATGMMLQGTQRGAEVPRVREGIASAVDELDATIAEIRTTIFALQQNEGEATPRSGVRTRVLREVGIAAVPLGFRPSVTFAGAVDAKVTDEVAQGLIAALREALSNTLRHARASRVDVTVDASVQLPDGRDAVRLTVADNGIGIPTDGRRRSGLDNLVRRAEQLGGRADWESGHEAVTHVPAHCPGPYPSPKGTQITWEAPLDAGEGAD
ncbi:GAF domain-containing sensor histidine kinase [Streptomyces sp. HNM0574]|uniref:GAF domain-containing sensor histidine kinase n=1 Tax=Streptomyces sp. HNM0574 TaxID=2714954 RepID=UPI00146A5B92|nr:GAF domain-containing sensor histidine kinase [Streptomyces sp. HNM0574]NLU69613.1 GAF domain-containing protein [Streptomyces sp. HNM0574]